MWVCVCTFTLLTFYLCCSGDVNVFTFGRGVMTRNGLAESFRAIRSGAVNEDRMEEYSVSFFHFEEHSTIQDIAGILFSYTNNLVVISLF